MDNHSRIEEFRRMAKDVISNSRDWAKSSQDLARTGSRRAKTFIHKQPMAATLIALAVGYVLGKVFSKKKAAPLLPELAKRAKRAR